MSLLHSIPVLTHSKIEEIIAGVWVIAAVTAFGFHFEIAGWFFAIKAAADTATSIFYAVQEARELRRWKKE